MPNNIRLEALLKTLKATCFIALAATPYQAIAANWTEISTSDGSQCTARHETGSMVMDDKFYLIGGRETRPVERYSPANNRWENLGASPIEMHHFQPVEWGNKIYIVGAYTCCYPNETTIDDVHIFNPQNKIWSLGPKMPNNRIRGAAGTVVYQNKIYIVGGNTQGHNGGAVAWFDEYDPSTGNWKQMPDAPNARDHFNAVVIGNKLIAAGGRQSSLPVGQQNVIAATDVFNFSTNKWESSAPNIPTPRAGTTSVVYGNEAIVIGGETARTNAYKEVQALNILTGQWRNLPQLNKARHGAGSGVIGNKIYVAAGNTVAGGGNEITSLERLNIESIGTPDPDTDNDGLSDDEETNTYNTDPNDADSDDDGLQDGDEITHGTNPNNPDSDNDNLSDGNEINTHQTNPNKADSDSDGLNDDVEINTHHTNPNKADSDNDSLSDKDEINTHHTNPNKEDSDDDGLKDAVELANNTNPNKKDSDDDGLDDKQELELGLDPNDPDTDSDTLNDGDEVNTHKTDPNNTDTDDDSLSDGDEVNTYKTDPNNVDSDDDTLSDGDEVNTHKTDPNNADSDSDDLDDNVEINQGSDPNDSDDPVKEPTPGNGNGDDGDDDSDEPTNNPSSSSGGAPGGGLLLAMCALLAFRSKR